jgi:ParB-like chromosome segregation protein Spo0J
MTQPTTDDEPLHAQLDRLDDSLSLRPLDAAHVLVLTGVLDLCPPIVVQRGSCRVLDGRHRAAAAAALGRDTIAVQWVDGDEATLLEAAISANSLHGLPLTHAQRKAAAARLLDLAPDWSNRRVARACGLSEATVRRMPRPGASATQVDTRTGSDGKAYPTTGAAVETARALLASEPHSSDRAIARAAGVSPTTVGRLRRTARPAKTRATRGRWLRRLLRVLAVLRRLLPQRP